MKLKTLARLLGIYFALWIFSFVCAIAIAETEILAEYRYLVYWGVAAFLLALGVLVTGLWLFSYHRLQKRMDALMNRDVPDRILGLEALLSRCRTASFRAPVSLNLVYTYLEDGRCEHAYTLLSLLIPEQALVFPRRAYRLLLRVCACMKNNRPLFDRFPGQRVDPKSFPFLSEEVLQRLKEWEG